MASSRYQPGLTWDDEKFYAASYYRPFVQTLPSPPAESQHHPFGVLDRQTATVAASVAYPPSMVPAPDHMGAPTSFTARRPNASNLPNFELPPPPLSGLHQKYQSYPNIHTTQPTATTLTSVGNLLTPPSNSSGDGISPSPSGITTGSSQGAVHPYTPNGGGGMWPPPNTGNTPYGYQSGGTPQQSFGQGRGLFSPSLNSIVRGNNSPTTSELPPPPYEVPQYATASVPMSAPNLPALHHHQQQQMIGNAMMGGQTPVSASVSHASPVHSQEAFTRPPPTPTYYNTSQPPSATSHQGSFSYSSGPSPVQQSPVSAHGPMKMSPVNGSGPMPPPHHAQQPYQRPYTYPLPGPVLSNVGNPGGHLQMVGGMPHGVMPGYNSGHAAQMHQLYGHPQQTPPNDRPFRCDQCPQSFNRNHDLKRHKRIHLAVKPFPCGHCDKSFSRKDALKVRTDKPITRNSG